MKEIKRKCQGCFEIKDRCDLIKITKLKNGELLINPASKELGRSAYVCKNEECIKTLVKKKRLKNALKCQNAGQISKIEEELKNFIKLLTKDN